MNYGFLIRNDRCIGCHACTTACKSENEVPVGVNRTWVKNVETGQYPNVTRHFQVTRCNHCANPPCVRICPTEAMYQRDDGIVEFDPEQCIGCKACLQACPYDAIYVDPESGTASKCHYCAHRVEMDLEPACVVVCPEHAIIAGDMDDPDSEISQMLAEYQTTVRKPEQGTAPKLFYTDGEETALTPTATDRTPETFAWADVVPLHEGDGAADLDPEYELPVVDAPSEAPRRAKSGATLRASQPQGVPDQGPIMVGDSNMANEMVRNVYNAQHKIPWHWPVPAYLVTKGIGAGLFLLLALGYGLGLFAFDALSFVTGGFLSLAFTAITTGLLVYDLERPERFFSIVTQPQWNSWLVRGAFLLMGFSAVAGVWWVLEAGAYFALFSSGPAELLRPILLWAGVPLAIGAAVYTAFLFGQAEGRDLWQSTLLPLHLIVQALMVGAATMLIADAFMAVPAALAQVAFITFAVSLVLDLLVTLLGEFGMPHASEAAAKAAHAISHGHYKRHFWQWSIMAGHLVPLALLLAGMPLVTALAGLLSIVGLYFYEYAFVMAPQEIPNS
ncbi:MAG: 4Fe-4S ferredoxin [Bacteroidetes bacterium]|jgi:Fe-S-cluster-containing dehydrogenase component/formate-dependent nitrite reductase membrane component NrfD|nr:4Fe-4S ferredoxin [Bacteroidota bacterium]